MMEHDKSLLSPFALSTMNDFGKALLVMVSPEPLV